MRIGRKKTIVTGALILGSVMMLTACGSNNESEKKLPAVRLK